MGALTLGKKGIIDQHCGSAIGKPEAACDQVGFDAASSARTLGLASTIGVVLGLAGIGAGAVLFFIEPRSAQPKTGTGMSISTELFLAGPDAGTVGVRGVW